MQAERQAIAEELGKFLAAEPVNFPVYMWSLVSVACIKIVLRECNLLSAIRWVGSIYSPSMGGVYWRCHPSSSNLSWCSEIVSLSKVSIWTSSINYQFSTGMYCQLLHGKHTGITGGWHYIQRLVSITSIGLSAQACVLALYRDALHHTLEIVS